MTSDGKSLLKRTRWSGRSIATVIDAFFARLMREFPTYVVIDHEGIVRFQSDRSIGERSMDLEDAIRKQVKIVAKSLD